MRPYSRIPQIGPYLAYKHALHIFKTRGMQGALVYFETQGLTTDEALKLVNELESELAIEDACRV